MTKFRRIRSKALFPIVEVTVPSVLLTKARVTVLALASRGFQYIGDMRRWARSSQVLQQKMEDIRLTNVWTSVWALNNTTFSDSAVSGLVFQGTMSVGSYNPPYPTDYVARVTISVTWTNSAHKVLTNRISSLICLNGLDKYIF